MAYAESRSLVAWLIEGYGPAHINALLESFRRNATIDRALIEVYGFDTDGLERRWRAEVGLPERAPRRAAEVEPLPTIPPLGGLLPRSEPTPVPTPAEEQGAVAGLPEQTGPQEPTPAPSGGSGCNRSGGDAAGIDLSLIAGLVFGALAIRRRAA